MGKAKPNSASGAPKKGPPEGAMALDETTVPGIEFLTEAERDTSGKLANAELDEIEKNREAIEKHQAALKVAKENVRARSKRHEVLSREALRGERRVDRIVRPYRCADGLIRDYDPTTWEQVGEPRAATDADRQGALYADRPADRHDESEGAE